MKKYTRYRKVTSKLQGIKLILMPSLWVLTECLIALRQSAFSARPLNIHLDEYQNLRQTECAK